MRALILAAGCGTRLELADGRPKCLAEIGGQPLLDRYLDTLDALDVATTIVAGYGAEQVRRHVSHRAIRPAIVMNSRYREGSIVSLDSGLATIDEDTLLLDGDVAFSPRLLTRLHGAPAPDALLVDVGAAFTDEQYMAGMRGGRVVSLRRGPVHGYDEHGEWVGFAKLSRTSLVGLRRSAGARITAGQSGGGYEDALAALLDNGSFACIPTDGDPWVEIDFPADLARARDLFRDTHRNVRP